MLIKLIPLICLLLVVPPTVFAQGGFKPGDQVEASPMALKDDKYYKACTFIGAESGAYVVECEGVRYVVGASYVRASKKAAAPTEVPPMPEPVRVAPAAKGEFKVGNRVLASVTGLKEEKYYRPCTVISPLKDGTYGLECDPLDGLPFMSFSVKPEWIKAWANATPAPVIECPFKKDYAKVSNKAPASADLFKSVIFETQNSTQNFYDFGVTFLDFQLGKVFKNRAIGNGRKDVDTAHIGATIHNVKTKQLICQKSSTITKRWVAEIEYACYKSEYGEWVCKNGAPKYLEQTSIPNK